MCSLAARGYVAGNLMAAFVTGADGNFDKVIKDFFIPFQFDSVFCFYFIFAFRQISKCIMNE